MHPAVKMEDLYTRTSGVILTVIKYEDLSGFTESATGERLCYGREAIHTVVSAHRHAFSYIYQNLRSYMNSYNYR